METEQSHRVAGRRRAAGIYGTIITAAVLASAAGHLPTAALAVAVLVTLVAYWLAEQYADVLGEQIVQGRPPSWARIGAGLASTWPMVSAAYIPVLVLIVVRVIGASKTASANIALAVAVALLVVHGWTAGRAAGLRGVPLLVVTSIAGGLGVLMIVLKNFVVTNLH
jgi:positive regulator of sigma E activity